MFIQIYSCTGMDCDHVLHSAVHEKQELVENLSTLKRTKYATVLREGLLAIEHTLVFISRKFSCRRDATNFDQSCVPL